jgi:hypothetical protein
MVLEKKCIKIYIHLKLKILLISIEIEEFLLLMRSLKKIANQIIKVLVFKILSSLEKLVVEDMVQFIKYSI